MFIVRRLMIAAVLLASLGTAAWAYRAAPLVHFLTPTGAGAASFLTIDNPHEYPLTLELITERRRIEGGRVVADEPGDDALLVFPPQAIVAPGKSQRVQFRYVGDPIDDGELYRIRIEQVPVDLDKGGEAAIKMSYNFVAAVFVAPEGAKAVLDVTDVQAADAGYAVSVRNDGQMHAVLQEVDWTVAGASGTVELDGSDLDFGDLRFVEPGGAVTLTLPGAALETVGAVESVTANVQYRS